MYNLNVVYNKEYYKQGKSLAWRVPIVVDAIMQVMAPKLVVDVGCGNGDLLGGFSQKIKAPCYGIEGTLSALSAIDETLGISVFTPSTTPYIFMRDLRGPLNLLLHKVDLAICFEVAEHIEEEYANIFVDNLCSLSDRILMTAAPPGQGGNHHVNCQPYAYWLYKFLGKGYRYDHTVVNQLKNIWRPWRHKKGIKAYYNNLMCWERIEK